MVDLHCHCDQFSLFPNLARARKKRDRAVPDDIDPPHETWPACRVEIENEAVRKRWEWRRKGSTKQRENEVKGAWNSVRHALVQKTCTVRLPDLRHDVSWPNVCGVGHVENGGPNVQMGLGGGGHHHARGQVGRAGWRDRGCGAVNVVLKT